MQPLQQAPRELVLLVATAVTAGVTVATAGAATAEVVLLAATIAQPSNHLTRISKEADSSEPASFFVIPNLFGNLVIPGLFGNLPLRQWLQHRALAASQPCTGKCALTLQPTAAGNHRHS